MGEFAFALFEHRSIPASRPRQHAYKLTVKGKHVDEMFSALYRTSRDEKLFDVTRLAPPQVWFDRLVERVQEDRRLLRASLLKGDDGGVANSERDTTGADEAEQALGEECRPNAKKELRCPVSRPVILQDGICDMCIIS